ncbi:MAG: hypothetical protein ACYC27_03465 [Armatimonadota bacterium]
MKRIHWVVLLAVMVVCFIILSGCAKKETAKTSSFIRLNATAVRNISGGLVIMGSTNLPDGTKIGVELYKDNKLEAKDFDVFVKSGKFKSTGFMNKTKPISQGPYRVHILSYFNSSWQSPEVLEFVGEDGANLKNSEVVILANPKARDNKRVLDYSVELTVP